jgi:hypothetical protein
MVEADDLASVLHTLHAGDTVEITYADKQKGGSATVKRRVAMSWEEYKSKAVRDGTPEQQFHFKFKAKPSVMLEPSSANKAHKNKPGGGMGSLADYGDSVQFQATMSTPVKTVTALRKL